MIRTFRVLTLIGCGLGTVALADLAGAQPGRTADPDQCASWVAVAADKPGMRWRIAPVQLGAGRSDVTVEGIADVPGLGPTSGTFLVPANSWIGLLADADSGELAEPYPFTTMPNVPVVFRFADPREAGLVNRVTGGDIRILERVTSGHFKPFALPPLRAIACVRSAAVAHYGPDTPPAAKSLVDRLLPDAPKAPRAKSLGDLFGETTGDSPKSAPSRPAARPDDRESGDSAFRLSDGDRD
jgi:hypothetical protein